MFIKYYLKKRGPTLFRHIKNGHIYYQVDTISDDDIFEIDRETSGGRRPRGRSDRKSRGGSW